MAIRRRIPDAAEGELVHAIELVELARAIGGFCIGVAAHPAGHPRSPDMKSDRDYLAEKMRLADFAVTQFFFRARGVSVAWWTTWPPGAWTNRWSRESCR